MFFSSPEKKKTLHRRLPFTMLPSSSADVNCAMRVQPKQFPRKDLLLFCLQSEGKPPRLCECLLYLNKGASATLRLKTVFDLAFESLSNTDIFVFKTNNPPFVGPIASFTSPSRKNPHNARVTFLKEVGTCCEAQVLRIMLHVNKRRKLRTFSLTLINPLVNPNIHELKYCDKHFDQPNFSDLGSSSPGFLQTSKGTN